MGDPKPLFPTFQPQTHPGFSGSSRLRFPMEFPGISPQNPLPKSRLFWEFRTPGGGAILEFSSWDLRSFPNIFPGFFSRFSQPDLGAGLVHSQKSNPAPNARELGNFVSQIPMITIFLMELGNSGIFPWIPGCFSQFSRGKFLIPSLLRSSLGSLGIPKFPGFFFWDLDSWNFWDSPFQDFLGSLPILSRFSQKILWNDGKKTLEKWENLPWEFWDGVGILGFPIPGVL